MIIFTGVYKQLTLKCFSRGGESVRIRGFLPSTPNERGVIMASQRRQHILLVEDDAVMHYCYFHVAFWCVAVISVDSHFKEVTCFISFGT
jgi:hypothetical protein